MLHLDIEIPGGHGIFAILVRCWWTILGNYNAFRYFCMDFNSPHRRFDWRRVGKKTGCIAIVTGGTKGIGAEVVKKLLQCDMRVIIGCRRLSDGHEVVKRIRQKGITTGTAEILSLDLSSLTSVREFAYKILSRKIPVSVLINNAEVKFVPFGVTVDGFEHHFQVNYLSHFLLTFLLLPRLKEAGSAKHCSRVIHVTSICNYGIHPDLADLQLSQIYSATRSYCNSKCLQMGMSNYLESQLQVEKSFVHSYTVHPGILGSDLWIWVSWIRKVPLLGHFVFRVPDLAADSVLYAAVSPQVDSRSQSRHEFLCMHQKTMTDDSWDETSQERLWKISCKYVDLVEDSNDNSVEEENFQSPFTVKCHNSTFERSQSQNPFRHSSTIACHIKNILFRHFPNDFNNLKFSLISPLTLVPKYLLSLILPSIYFAFKPIEIFLRVVQSGRNTANNICKHILSNFAFQKVGLGRLQSVVNFMYNHNHE